MKFTPTEAPSEALFERIRSQQGSGKLDLSLCEITKIPLKAIQEHYDDKLNELDLSFNLIRYMKPLFVLDMEQLTKLNLAKNDLQKLPDNFGEMKQLTYLDVHANQLKTLPLSMGGMYNLSYLNISENPFRAPISTLLEKQMKDNHEKDAFPVLITEFLRGLQKELPHDRSKENLWTRRRRKTISFQGDSEKNIETNQKTGTKASQRKLELTLRDFDNKVSRCPATGSDIHKRSSHVWESVGITTTVVIMIPLLLAVAIDSAFLDNLTQDTVTPATIWSKYKPYHCFLQRLVNWCNPQRALITRGPTPAPMLHDFGLLSVIRNYFKAMFNYIMVVPQQQRNTFFIFYPAFVQLPIFFTMVIIEEMYANPPVPESLLERIKQQTNSVLDLSLCNLIQVPLGAIQETRQQYKKLEGFDLSYNSIRYLSPDFAIDMVNLLETLPISMGKMTHLKYLSISDNPFRAPLCNIFCPGAFGQEISGFAQADLVIKFLAEMSTEITAAGDNSQESFLRRRNSQVHYNERSMTGLEYETDEVLSNASHSSNELAVELDEENNLKISHSQPTTNSRKNERKSAMSKRSKYKSENLTCSSNYSCRSKAIDNS
ncbi:Leucine-rich repeat-containing protein 59 [Orchesella cincta]|uniref:Leucine-rich repeat-containing protein 59 n=1 Tax=Orchesella cincta TaxID=48709 RepID=A0A1D2NKT8_ORCCI|nr:Leucine-rich repeat-containing protein 59 [Orchesella cincta]